MEKIAREYVSLLNTKRRKCTILLLCCIGVVLVMFTSKARFQTPLVLTKAKDSDESYSGLVTSSTPSSTSTTTTTTSTTTTTTTTTATTKQFSTTPPFAINAENMIYVAAKPLRCKAQFVGCFVPLLPKGTSKTLKVSLGGQNGPLKEKCLNECYKRGNHLAGLNEKSRSCVCSKTFDGFLSNKKGGPLPEAGLDRSKDCKSTLTLRVYNVMRPCERGVLKSSMGTDRLGCIEIPKSLNGLMIALKHSKMTAEQCILNCEIRRFTYAVPMEHEGVCLCSDANSLFRTPGNMHTMLGDCDSAESGRVPVFRTVVEDNNCAPIRFLKKGQLAPILLASYYGSGNTWIRHLIEVSTGYFTGSVYRDGNLYEGGMLGELEPPEMGRTIAVKDHLFKLQVLPIFHSAILLLRNPYDATLAEWNRRQTRNHTGVVDPIVFKTPAFKKYVSHRPEYWFNIVDQVLKSLTKVLVVYYEDLKMNATREMRRIADFLPENVRPSGDDFSQRLMCMNLDLVGKFKRPPRNLDFDPFDAFVRNSFDQKIRDLDDLLIKYNQPPLPDSYFLPS